MKSILTIIIVAICAFRTMVQEKIGGHNNDLWFLLHGQYTLSNKGEFEKNRITHCNSHYIIIYH